MTLEDLGKLVSDLGAKVQDMDARYGKRLNDQSAILDEVRKPRIETKDAPASAPMTDERLRKLESEQAALKAEREALKMQRIESALSESFAELGVKPALARDLASVEVSRNPKLFDMTGEEVTAKDGEKVIPAALWADLFLGTDRGRAYLPEQRNPSLGPGGLSSEGAAVPKTTITGDDLANGRYDPSKKLSEVRFKER